MPSGDIENRFLFSRLKKDAMSWDSVVYFDLDSIRQYSQIHFVGPQKLQTGNDAVEQPAMKEEDKLVDRNCQLDATGNKEKGKVARTGRPLNMSDRYKILTLYERGHKISHIARLIGCTHSCVSKIMSRYRRTGSMCPRSTRIVENKSDSDDSSACVPPPPPLPYSIERLLA